MFEHLVDSNTPYLVAGPCAAESYLQLQQTYEALMRPAAPWPVALLRFGAWKPRTRPGGFEGRGEEALQWMARLKATHPHWHFATEVATPQHVETALRYPLDALWIGARTTANPFLVDELAQALRGTAMPVMVKNPVSPDLALWMGAIERLQQVGLTDLAAVHRGFQSLASARHALRNDPLWELPMELRRAMPQLPLLCDPSHLGGSRAQVAPLAQTALNLDFDGLMIECHVAPDQALTDAAQQLAPQQLFDLLAALSLPAHAEAPAAATKELTVLREQLDLVDDGILRLLAQRRDLACQIAAVKTRHGMTLYQPRRWDAKLRALSLQAEALGLDVAAVRKLFQQLHMASICAQQDWQKEHPQKQ